MGSQLSVLAEALGMKVIYYVSAWHGESMCAFMICPCFHTLSCGTYMLMLLLLLLLLLMPISCPPPQDIIPKLPLGNAVGVDSLEQLLDEADFVSLHVPALPETVNLIAGKVTHAEMCAACRCRVRAAQWHLARIRHCIIMPLSHSPCMLCDVTNGRRLSYFMHMSHTFP